MLIAGHDRPALPADPRIRFLPMDWPVAPPGPHNDDSGRKKHVLSEAVLAQGGGLMMIVDADDWVERGMVAVARARLAGEEAGGVVTEGEVVDLSTLRAAALPCPGVFGDFHRVCGSSTVARLRPQARDLLRRDPFAVLRSHHAWLERAAQVGAALVRLPVRAAYLVGTSINHSDVHGPHPDWRRGFVAAVNAAGRPLDPALADRFGLTLGAVERVRALLPAPPSPQPPA